MVVFVVALIFYSVQTLCIKITMQKYGVTAQELLYYVSLIMTILFFISSRLNSVKDEKGKVMGPVDLLDIEPTVYWPLAGRVFFGFCSDIFVFLAYNYMSFAKTTCTFFTNTLMIPFFACCFLRDPVKTKDMIAIVAGFIGMVLVI